MINITILLDGTPVSGNVVEPFLRSDRMPHIWCPGCGIGTTVNSFAHALIDSKIDLKTVALVSGIGCTGRVAGYVQSRFVPHHARARDSIRHRTEARESEIECCRLLGRRRSLGHRRQSPDSRRPPQHRSQGHLREQPHLCDDRRPDRAHHSRPCHHLDLALRPCEPSFNLPHLVEAAGAVYVARWTTFHVRQLARSIGEAFRKKASASSKSSRPAPRSTSAATRWATASTP